ncbi:uncharacterized protein M6B38_373495 [Iris pallida]|uniref:Retrotransposon gag domain-containing protein n=1 Tax=Iris pallida TaxID=29817 RepID=A0AAX6GCL4_IRIPA|nr:uncharacterized protein M6B38_373495 [Iris pallida]
MTERLGVPTLISTDSTEGATPSESAMERLLRLMELQQRQSETQQRQLQEQIQAQVSAQQKQMDALTRIVSTIATQQSSTTVMSEEEVQAEKTKHVSSSSLLKMTKFKKMNPPEFNGRAEPDEVIGWLVKIESLFTLLSIKGSKKVGCAALQLNLRAYDWWEAKKQELQESNPNAKISWETFKRAFLEQYIPRALRRQKEEEFMSLKQGNLSVEDYDAKFAKLAKFAEAFLSNTEAWCEHFQQGLNEDLRRDVMNQRCQTYRESYNAALDMERVFGRASQKGGSSIRNSTTSTSVLTTQKDLVRQSARIRPSIGGLTQAYDAIAATRWDIWRSIVEGMLQVWPARSQGSILSNGKGEPTSTKGRLELEQGTSRPWRKCDAREPTKSPRGARPSLRTDSGRSLCVRHCRDM